MPGIGNNSETLLNGLSGFWLRFFADIGDIRALYEGTEILLGQVYLDMLSQILNISVQGAPLFHREYYRLLTIREDQLIYRDDGTPSGSRYVNITPDIWTSIPQLQNTVWKPTASLEDKLDYEVVAGSIRFLTNPLNQNAYQDGLGGVAPAQPLNGFGVNHVNIGIGGVFTSSANFYAKGVRNGDVVTFHPRTRTSTLTVASLTVLQATPAQLAFAPGTVLPADLTLAYGWTVTRKLVDGTTSVVYDSVVPDEDGKFQSQSTMLVQQISMWVVDGKFDEFTLYENFGHFFGPAQLSSENYRAFIRGIMQLYIFGPTIERVASALNLVANLPVIRSDGETLENYYTDAQGQYVVTNVDTYTFPLGIPIRPDVVALTAGPFRAFEPLTTAIKVEDYVTNPRWWYTITIPVTLLPGRAVQYRKVTELIWPNEIGPYGRWLIGDPNIYIGADEDGRVLPPHGTDITCFRHSTSFFLMQKYLKTHIVHITIDRSIELTGVLVQSMQDLLQQVKPSHTMIYFAPQTFFTDTIHVSDTFSAEAYMAIGPDVVHTSNPLILGTLWHIGDGFKYGPLVVAQTSTDPLLCPITIGGPDPLYVETDAGPNTAHLFDQPLYVRAYNV